MTSEFNAGSRARLCQNPSSPCRLADGAPLCDPATFDVAVRWAAAAPAASAAEREAFEAWLAQSDCHVCVWARVRYLWAILGEAL